MHELDNFEIKNYNFGEMAGHIREIITGAVNGEFVVKEEDGEFTDWSPSQKTASKIALNAFDRFIEQIFSDLTLLKAVESLYLKSQIADLDPAEYDKALALASENLGLDTYEEIADLEDEDAECIISRSEAGVLLDTAREHYDFEDLADYDGSFDYIFDSDETDDDFDGIFS